MNESVFVDHASQHSLTTVENERHTLGESGSPFSDSFYLRSPGVIASTIVVTDSQKVQRYLAGFDYQILTEGSRTRIQWLATPGQQTPSSVLVSYRTESTPEGEYDTLSESFELRFELWKNRVTPYGRVSVSANDAPHDLHVVSFSMYQAGVDVNWRWLRAGAQYEIYQSGESDYHAKRLYQSATFQLDAQSSFNIDFRETWIDYQNVRRPEEQDYRVITRYHQNLTQQLGFDFEAGVALRRGLGVDQLLSTVRPSIRYAIGRTAINVGFDYEYNLFVTREERQKYLAFLRLRRAF
jgi:hypothetical protein